MEIYQLRYFLEVVDCRNFTRAAERLRIAQPALSQQIRNLEEELGLPLLIRGKRESQTTEAGALLAERARTILDLVQETAVAIKDMVDLRTGSLSIACIPTVSSRLLPGWLAGFRIDYPVIDIILREGTSNQVESWVSSGECELGFTQLPTETNGLDSTEVYLDRFAVLMPADHTLASRDSVVLSRLRGESMILYRGGKLADFILSCCRTSGWDPKIVCETGEFETLRSLVSVGLGIAVVPEMTSAPHALGPATNLRAVPLKDHRLQRRIGVIRRLQPPPPPSPRAFIQKILPGHIPQNSRK